MAKENDELKMQAHLLAYDILKTYASWLENPDNDLFGLLEFDDDSLKIAAKGATIAAAVLKKAAIDIQLVSGIEDTNKYEKNVIDAMSELKSLADEFDLSGDESLVKKASALDEILFIMASNVEAQEKFKNNFDKKIEDIKERSKKLNEKVATEKNEEKKVDKKEYRPLQAALSSRYCPDHPGAMLIRIRDGLAYCPYDSKQYDFREGYTTMKGDRVPGSSVENQTQNLADVVIPALFSDKK